MYETILVTGGAGFIGCALSKQLIDQGCKVVVVDNLHPQVHKHQVRPEALHSQAELIVGDVCDPDCWNSVLSAWKPQAIVHLAAETGTAQSLSEATRHAMVNVVGTTQMLDALTRHNHVPQAIVLTSSRAVYGEGRWKGEDGTTFYPSGRSHKQLARGEWGFAKDGKVATPTPHRASEVFPNPSSVYGSTKLAQEHVLKSWCAAMNVPVTLLRLQNVYGPGQSPFNPYTGIINIFHKIAYSGGTIEVYEDGEIGRDFIFIDDVVRSIVAALNIPQQGVRQFDVGTGKATTILEAATLISTLHSAPKPVICQKFRDGDIRWAVADVQPLAEALGVSPRVDFMDSGARLVGEWLLARGYLE